MVKRQNQITPEQIQKVASELISAKTSMQNATEELQKAKNKFETMENQLKNATASYENMLARIGEKID